MLRTITSRTSQRPRIALDAGVSLASAVGSTLAIFAAYLVGAALFSPLTGLAALLTGTRCGLSCLTRITAMSFIVAGLIWLIVGRAAHRTTAPRPRRWVSGYTNGKSVITGPKRQPRRRAGWGKSACAHGDASVTIPDM